MTYKYSKKLPKYTCIRLQNCNKTCLKGTLLGAFEGEFQENLVQTIITPLRRLPSTTTNWVCEVSTFSESLEYNGRTLVYIGGQFVGHCCFVRFIFVDFFTGFSFCLHNFPTFRLLYNVNSSISM